MSKLEEETKTAEDLLEKRFLSQPSRLGSTAKLKGEWICNEDVIIQGHLQGKIDLGNHDLHIETDIFNGFLDAHSDRFLDRCFAESA